MNREKEFQLIINLKKNFFADHNENYDLSKSENKSHIKKFSQPSSMKKTDKFASFCFSNSRKYHFDEIRFLQFSATYAKIENSARKISRYDLQSSWKDLPPFKNHKALF